MNTPSVGTAKPSNNFSSSVFLPPSYITNRCLLSRASWHISQSRSITTSPRRNLSTSSRSVPSSSTVNFWPACGRSGVALSVPPSCTIDSLSVDGTSGVTRSVPPSSSVDGTSGVFPSTPVHLYIRYFLAPAADASSALGSGAPLGPATFDKAASGLDAPASLTLTPGASPAPLVVSVPDAFTSTKVSLYWLCDHKISCNGVEPCDSGLPKTSFKSKSKD